MNNNLFVGGFPYETTQEELSALFRSCGTVVSAKILVERETGRSRGLGFIEMSTETEARSAIAKINGSTLGSRKIFVSEARPQEKRPGGFLEKPGFVERRSGKDRRQARGERPTADAGRREAPFERKKKWSDKPAFSGKKKWEKRPSFSSEPNKTWSEKPGAGGDKRKGPGGKKKWGPGGPGGGNKWGGKPRRFSGGR